MIISQEKIKKIRDLINRHYNALIFKIAGPEQLTDDEIKALVESGLVDIDGDNGKIKEGYYIGRARNTIDPRLRDDMTISQFNAQLRNTAVPISDTERFAIEHIASSAGNLITNLKDKAKTVVEQIIADNNLEYRNKLITETIRPTIIEGIEQDKGVMKIASELREKTGDLFRDWKRVSVTEVASAMNLGEADAIVSRNKGKSPDSIYVYKRVNHDSALCNHCKKAYVMPNGITPKVYTLSELQQNGTNYGKKASDYKATITPIHPNCRCSLVEIPNGWTFNQQGQMIYKGPDFIQYRDAQ